MKALLRLKMKLAHLPFLASKRVDHPHRAQAFLRLGQKSALLLLNRRRIPPDPMREEIDGAYDGGNHPEREQGQLPVNPGHDTERAHQSNRGAEDVGKALVVDRLD